MQEKKKKNTTRQQQRQHRCMNEKIKARGKEPTKHLLLLLLSF